MPQTVGSMGLLGGHHRLDEGRVRPTRHRGIHPEQLGQPQGIAQHVVLTDIASCRHHPDGLDIVAARQVGQRERVVNPRVAIEQNRQETCGHGVRIEALHRTTDR